MCGIAGYIGRGSTSLLERMGASIAHRGPDDAGVWLDPPGRVGLAHRRLSILDLSARGHQPMLAEGGAIAIVYNGEIYNFRELRAELEARGHIFASTSDTEVLLNGYREFGPSFVARLNGIFAFCIHDTRSGESFLARDHFGVKPLYLCELADTVLFASELKALLVDPRVSRELDSEALARYLTFLWSPGVATPLRDVKRVPPGTALFVRDGRVVRTWCYHSPVAPAQAGRSEGEMRDGVVEHLRRAVHRQMVADVPVGAFLSGGLDSSAVAAFARETADGGRLQCFTIAPSETEMRAEGIAEDLPYARRVARHLGVELHEIPVDSSMVGQLGHAIFHLDEPQADPAAINVMMIASLARSRGMKVLLSGTGGDDLFTGYRRHRALLAERYWGWLPRPARALIGRAAGSLPVRDPRMRRIRKALQDAGLAPEHRCAGYFHWLAPATAAGLLRRPVAAAAVDAPLIELLDALPRGTSRLRGMLALEQRFFLADHNLLYTDKLSMAHGVEARVPFLDRDLVDYANALPSSVKQRGAEGKWILKAAMEPYLPRDVIYRPKTGFGAPLRAWIRGPLAPVIERVLSTDSLERRGVFDPLAVRRLVESDRAGALDASYTVFSLLCIELWARTFLDAPEPRPIERLMDVA